MLRWCAVFLLVVLLAVGEWLLSSPGHANATGDVAAQDAASAKAVLSDSAPDAGEPMSRPLPRFDAASDPAAEPGVRRYLLVGVDRRADGRGPALADTIVVLTVDAEAERAGLLSVPRDLYVDVPGHGPDRINTVLGHARRAGKDPLATLSDVIEDVLGWRVDQALVIDLSVFERAVDAVGGVSVVVPCPLHERFVDARAPGGRRVLDLAPGPQRLDGRTAAMYVRARRGAADWTRARRQQAVLLAVREELVRGGWGRLPRLWSEFEDSVTTNMRRIDVLALAASLLDIDAEHLHGVVLGRRETEDYWTPEGHAVLLARPDELRRAVDGLFEAAAPGVRPKHARCPKVSAARSRDAG